MFMSHFPSKSLPESLKVPKKKTKSDQSQISFLKLGQKLHNISEKTSQRHRGRAESAGLPVR